MNCSISWIWPGIEADRGLVEDEDLGIVDERLREPDALAEALREVAEQAARHRRSRPQVASTRSIAPSMSPRASRAAWPRTEGTATTVMSL